jgi:hypothetical protein
MDAKPRLPRASRLGCLTLAVLFTACGGDDPTAPVDVDLTGGWSYSISNATGVGVTGVCSIDAMFLTFTSSSSSGIIDALGDHNIVCISGSTTLREAYGGAMLESITVSGSDVGFQFHGLTSDALSPTTPVISQGTVASGGNTMSGTVTFALIFGTPSGPVTRAFTGSWTAIRM